MQTFALIVAAGRGARAGGDIPKQYQILAGKPVLAHAVAAFARHPAIDDVVVVIHPDDANLCAEALRDAAAPVRIVHGGATRDQSVRAGLAALPPAPARVLIHDAARPLVSARIIDRVIAALAQHAGAAPGLAVTDTLWQVSGGSITGQTPRDGLWRAQTPQGFDLAGIRAAHAQHGADTTDDVGAALAAGLDVVAVPGSEDNFKLTHPADFPRAEKILESRKVDIRTGNGFDVHKFGDGNSVTLCGVEIAHEKGLVGHSDADVGMHALTDALYGALALGDIGQHFPPSDPQWKGAASHIFLAHAAKQVRAAGYRISNADITLICERPKIGPHAADMRAALAKILGLAADRISVKATTSEKLGFTGRQEGIAAMATATVIAQ